MRRLCTGLMAAALVLGLLAVEPLEAKVYKMKPEERAAALKEKKAKGAKAKKAGKAVPGQDQGGWVEVKPGERIAKKNRKAKVDEIAKAAEQKGKKGKKGKKDEALAEKPEKKSKKSKKEALETPAEKPEQKGKKAKKDAAEEIVVEKKGKKSKADKKAKEASARPDKADKADKAEKKGKKSRKSASSGDRVVGSSYSGEHKVSASSAEVRRPGGAPAAQSAPADDLSNYSVSRPGQEKTAVAPEVRQEVQPGPIDPAKPVGTEHKAGEGRF